MAPSTACAHLDHTVTHGRVILARAAAARADLTMSPCSLRVGAIQCVGATLLPPLLDELAQEAPDLDITLTQTTADDELLALLSAGELDVTFAARGGVRLGAGGRGRR